MLKQSRHSDPETSVLGETQRAIGTLEHLIELLRGGAELDRLIDGYMESRRLLAGTFRRLLQSTILSGGPLIDRARALTLDAMKARYGAVMPEEILFVRNFGSIHALLLAYLCERVGRPVPASRLRVLTGDQVHSERRMRELRDLGFRLETGVMSGEQHYTLMSADPDVETAALKQARANIKSSKTLGKPLKHELLLVLGEAKS
jgi:hypothetical protein